MSNIYYFNKYFELIINKHCCLSKFTQYDGIYLLSLHTGEKPDTKDFRSDPPGKIKLPGLHKPLVPPPPVKEKPIKLPPK